MRKIPLILSLLCAQGVIAQSAPAQISGATCDSDIFDSRGYLYFDCSELPDEIRAELTALADSHNALRAMTDRELGELRKDTTLLRETYRLSRDEIERISSNQLQVDAKMENWRREQAVIQGNILDIVREIDVNVESYRQQLSDATQVQFLQLESQADKVRESLTRMELRILKVETNVSTLMDEVFSGKYDESILFYGVSAGALQSDDGDHTFFALNAEWVLPEWIFGSTNAITGEIVALDWEETVAFDTLPGLPDREITTDRDVLLVGGGVKVFLTGDRLPIYAGATLGYAFEDLETWYFGIPLGVEYSTRSARLLVEYRFNYFSAVEEREVRFDNFGDAEISISENSENTNMFSFKLLFR